LKDKILAYWVTIRK